MWRVEGRSGRSPSVSFLEPSTPLYTRQRLVFIQSFSNLPQYPISVYDITSFTSLGFHPVILFFMASFVLSFHLFCKHSRCCFTSVVRFVSLFSGPFFLELSFSNITPLVFFLFFFLFFSLLSSSHSFSVFCVGLYIFYIKFCQFSACSCTHLPCFLSKRHLLCVLSTCFITRFYPLFFCIPSWI